MISDSLSLIKNFQSDLLSTDILYNPIQIEHEFQEVPHIPNKFEPYRGRFGSAFEGG